jgi:hypothetical protein
MRSKLTLSIEKKTINKAKQLAQKRGNTVSKMFADFIEETSRIEEKMDALREVSGIIDLPEAAEPDQEYAGHIRKKHGW